MTQSYIIRYRILYMTKNLQGYGSSYQMVLWLKGDIDYLFSLNGKLYILTEMMITGTKKNNI